MEAQRRERERRLVALSRRASLRQGRKSPAASADGPAADTAAAARPDLERDDIGRDLERVAALGARILGADDPEMPLRLRVIPDRPVALFVRGDPELLAVPQVAIVGSRRATRAGERIARRLAGELAVRGVVVTSGLAQGIDAEAHRGALEAGGKTIAVLGSALDRVYPAVHRRLADAIVERGALVSEFPLGTPPLPRNFPWRNRLISGLSLGVLVVEAAERSGSLITARLAADQGREVFAVPGSILNPLAAGCHRLIRDGAKLVERVEDILEELPVDELATLPAPSEGLPEASPARAAPVFAAGSDEAVVLDQLQYEPASAATLARRTGLTPEQVCSILLVLEVDDRVRMDPVGRYLRVG